LYQYLHRVHLKPPAHRQHWEPCAQMVLERCQVPAPQHLSLSFPSPAGLILHLMPSYHTSHVSSSHTCQVRPCLRTFARTVVSATWRIPPWWWHAWLYLSSNITSSEKLGHFVNFAALYPGPRPHTHLCHSRFALYSKV
jgi:hypothetical protein